MAPVTFGLRVNGYVAQHLPAFATGDSAKPLVTRRLEDRGLAPRRRGRHAPLEPPLPPGEHRLGTLRPPAAEQRQDLVRRRLLRQPRLRLRRELLERGIG